MRYFLIAGEPSGDLHGANLMRGLKEHDPSAEFHFWGGDKMAEVGGVENLGVHYRDSSFFGFLQIARNIRTIMKQMSQCKCEIEEFKPDVVILIDYAGFNLKIAKFTKERGIKTFFYIAPKVWAWNEKRVEKLKRYVDELFIIFPFEREYFAQRGVEAHFEGNPLVDAIEMRCQEMPSREEFLKQHKIPTDRPLVALVAGSRKTEIKANLPLMRLVAEEYPEYQFIVAGVDWIARKEYDKWLVGSDIRIVDGATYELIRYSEAAIVTSGTATLETALIGTPEVVIFRIPAFHLFFMPLVVKIPFISLVNINLNRECVKEVIQSSLDTETTSSALRKILIGGEGREKMLEDYDELKTIIGESRASSSFAKRMIELLQTKR